MAEQSVAEREAKILFRHYIKQLSYYSGFRYDSDVEAELNDLVDYIIQAAVEKMREELKNE